MSKMTIHGDNSPIGVLRHWERKTKQECAREILRCWQEAESLKSQLVALREALEQITSKRYCGPATEIAQDALASTAETAEKVRREIVSGALFDLADQIDESCGYMDEIRDGDLDAAESCVREISSDDLREQAQQLRGGEKGIASAPLDFRASDERPDAEDDGADFIVLNPCDGFHVVMAMFDGREFEGFHPFAGELLPESFYCAWAKLPNSRELAEQFQPPQCSLHGRLAEDGKCDVCEGRGLWSDVEDVPPEDIIGAMSGEFEPDGGEKS